MKKLIISVLAFMLCICIGGCDAVNETPGVINTPEVTNTPEATNKLKPGNINSEFFDVNKKDLPTREDVKKVKKGMLFSEVTDLIGKPQRDVGSGPYIYEYDLKDGSIFRTWFYDTGEYYVKENMEYPIQYLSSYEIVE